LICIAIAAGNPPRRGRWNTIGLALSTLYVVWSILAQQGVEHRATVAIAREGLPVERMLATPAPFNTLLWRVVAVGADAHWEGFYTLGSGRTIDFNRYPHSPGLLDGIEDTWAVSRLQSFTKGFYSVTERDGSVVITDLRMGQAKFYAFAFHVGARRDGVTVPREDARYEYPRPPMTTVFEELYACGRGRPTEVIDC
jgi:inner membrane protein